MRVLPPRWHRRDRTDLAPADLEEQAQPLAARAEVEETAPLFSEFGVDEKIVSALAEVGITRTFAIQELTLAITMAGSDLIGQARTGTGRRSASASRCCTASPCRAARARPRRRW